MRRTTRSELPPKTGWPPGLLQDDHKGLSMWFASRPEARWLIRQLFPNAARSLPRKGPK